jgi:hypothetical protein
MSSPKDRSRFGGLKYPLMTGLFYPEKTQKEFAFGGKLRDGPENQLCVFCFFCLVVCVCGL